jgi:FkbM family methyltransferase
MSASLEQKLGKIERLARGNVLGRLLNNPFRYVSAIGFWRLVYPLTKQGRFAWARTFFGAGMEVVLPSATEIYLFGAKTHDSEIRLARYLMKNLRPGDTFCDVGSHFGYFSLLASQLVGENGRVLAFEASRSTFGILAKNTAPFQNITPLHRAASDEAKTLIFNEFPPLFSEYNSLVLPEMKNAAWMKNNPAQTIEVAGVRLDDFFAEGKTTPNIVKVDVEGAEPQVLGGMEQFLRKNAPLVVMEYLLSNGQNEAHRQAVAFAQTLGYALFRIKNNGELEACDNIEAAMKAEGLDSDNIVLRKI